MSAANKQLFVLALSTLIGCGQQLVEFPNPTTPSILATGPANLATGVSFGTAVSATFSESMDPATINSATFTLSQGANGIAGVVTYTGTTALFQPSAALTENTSYTATVTTGAKSSANEIGLSADYTWTFTTAVISPPFVVATNPEAASVGISTDQIIHAIFNTPMDPATITSSTFTLSHGATAVAGVVTYSGSTATFTPSAALIQDTLYTATITTGAKSAANEIALASNYAWTFTTVVIAPPPVPFIVSTNPEAGSTGNSTSPVINAVFSTAMTASTLNATTFLLTDGATSIPGSVTYSGTTATFTPTAALSENSSYTATVTTGAKSSAGVALASDNSWIFSTGGPAPSSPMVTVVDPSNNAIAVALNKVINVAFNESMDCTSFSTNTFTVLQAGVTPVSGVVACSLAKASFTPSAPLIFDTIYTADIKGGANGVKDLSGNPLSADYVWTFTTVDTTSPQIISVAPSDGATNVCPNAVVRASFDSAMDMTTIDSATFTLADPTGPVLGVVSYDSPSHTASFTPSLALTISTAYVATVTTGVKDESGNPLTSDKVWRFTTGSTLCQMPVNLQSLSTFVAVAGAGLTNSNSGGTTVLNGNVGLSPSATCLGDGSPCTALDPVINGTLYANDPAGVAAAAKVDLTNAYNDAFGRPPGTTVNDISGMVLPPGVYTSGSTMSIAVGGTLVLDAQGNANGVWIFQVGSSLTINDNAKVLLVNGAKASNVFWAIFASSTIGGNVEFKGDVLAGASNSVGTGSAVEGRLLCRTGQITLLSNTITLPAP